MGKDIEKKKGEKTMEVEISDDVASKKEYWDNYSILTTSYNKGRAEGRAEGLMEGQMINAKKMKEKGYPLKDISDITGLSANEIKKL